LGPPLRDELRRWFPPETIETAVEEYRALYPSHAIAPSVALPGAAEALAAVRAHGGRVVVVTSKLGRLARLHLDHLGFAVDELAGDLFAEGKAAALVEHGVRLYVGDHVADMVAARTAAVPGVGVTTGPCSAEELRAAGAAAVLDDLTGFPALLGGLVTGIAVGPAQQGG
jgi:phosphoglycolate phosphatase